MNTTFTIPNAMWLSSNHRIHWRPKAKRVKELRAMATIAGHSLPRFTRPVRVTAFIGYASNTTADPINAADTGKPLMDGLVSAGVFFDDSDKWVAGPDYRRDPVNSKRGFHTIRLEIEEMGEE